MTGRPSRPGLVARVLLALLDFYQKGISPLLPPSCRFQPTCSQYAVEAVRTHGALRGSALAAWRLLRCAPWSRGGWDPVPPRRGVHRQGNDDDDEPLARSPGVPPDDRDPHHPAFPERH